MLVWELVVICLGSWLEAGLGVGWKLVWELVGNWFGNWLGTPRLDADLCVKIVQFTAVEPVTLDAICVGLSPYVRLLPLDNVSLLAWLS